MYKVVTSTGFIFAHVAKETLVKLRKIFNLNTLKLSYTSKGNLSIIKTMQVQSLNRWENTWYCDCINKESCPLTCKCVAKCIVYQTKVTTAGRCVVYSRTLDREFKNRFNNHRSFRHKRFSTDTVLSKYFWKQNFGKI